MEPVGSTPQQLAEQMRSDMQRYGHAVKVSGAKVE
jgi:hypothetical protein